MIEFIEYGETTNGEKLFARVDENGLITMTCLEENPEYQAWLKDAAKQRFSGRTC